MELNRLLRKHFPRPADAGLRAKIREAILVDEKCPQIHSRAERVELLRSSLALSNWGEASMCALRDDLRRTEATDGR